MNCSSPFQMAKDVKIFESSHQRSKKAILLDGGDSRVRRAGIRQHPIGVLHSGFRVLIKENQIKNAILVDGVFYLATSNGLEPSTSSVTGWRANRLHHEAMWCEQLSSNKRNYSR